MPRPHDFLSLLTGGAARAIAEAALAGAAEITIVDRDPQRGSELVALLDARTQAAPGSWSGTGRIASRTAATSS